MLTACGSKSELIIEQLSDDEQIPVSSAGASSRGGGSRGGSSTRSDEMDASTHHQVDRDAGVEPQEDAGVDPTPVCGMEPPIVALLDPVWRVDTPARTTAHAFYEARFDRIAVYGGGPVINSRYYDQPVIAVDLEPPGARELSWTPADAPGFQFAAVARDENRQRTFVVGGWVGGSADSERAVELVTPDAASVVLRSLPNYPHAVRGSAAGWEPSTQRLVVFGGYLNGRYQNEAYALQPYADNAAWQSLSGLEVESVAATAYFVSMPDGLLLFARASGDQTLEVVYLLNPGGDVWQPIPLSEPLSYSAGPAFFDSASCSILWWGGRCDDVPRAIRLVDGIAEVTPIEVPAEIQTRVFDNVAIDPVRDQVIVQGGYDCQIRDRYLEAVAYPIVR